VPRASEAMAAVCPHCGATVGPELSALEQDGPEREAVHSGRRHRDAMVSWVVSVCLHLAVLTVLVLIAWPAASQRRADDAERDVGVVLPADRPPIEPGAAGAMRFEPAAGELHIPQLEDSTQIKPLRNVTETARPGSTVERMISIDVGSGGEFPAAMKGDWTDLAAGGAGAGRGGASFFGLEAAGRRFVFVVDRSGSMKGEKLEAAKAELVRSIRALDRGASFYTVFFNHTHMAMPAQELVRATEGSKRKHFAWVGTVTADGGTNPVSAMRLALSLKPDAIWLLSDGQFKPAAVDIIRKANPGRKVQIHTLAFYSQAGEKVLQRIAAENRGRYRFVTPGAIGLGEKGL